MLTRAILISLLLLLPACMGKTNTVQVLPPGLLVDGEPLDPFCFAASHSMEDGLADVPVKNCESPALIKGEMFEKSPQSYGVHYTYEGEEHSMARPYMLYQFVGSDLTLPPSEVRAPQALPALDDPFPVSCITTPAARAIFPTCSGCAVRAM